MYDHSVTSDNVILDDRLIALVRNECIRVAQGAYERAREEGICAEGAFEVALGAIACIDDIDAATLVGVKNPWIRTDPGETGRR